MDKDIKESREYRLAKDWEMAVNNYSFNPARFAAAIPTMHPTLQQSLYAGTTNAIWLHTRKRNVSWST